MAVTNCTISSITINPTAGSVLGSQTGTLTITPSTGYVVAASAFTNNTNLTATNSDGTLTNTSKAVQSIGSATDTGTPSTAGNTVTFLITFSPGFVMPSSNLTLEVDIDGAATQAPSTIAGTVDRLISNVTSVLAGHTNGGGSSSVTVDTFDTAYSNSGNESTGETIFTNTITPSSDYAWVEEPTHEITTGVASNYTVTKTGTGSTSARVFTVVYEYPNTSPSTDKIKFFAKAEYSPTVTSSIKSYQVDLTPISKRGGSKIFYVYGTSGATYSLLVAKDRKTGGYSTDTLDSGATIIHKVTNVSIDSSGISAQVVNIPASSTNETIVFSLTGSSMETSLKTHGNFAIVEVDQKADVSFTLSFTETGASKIDSISDITLATGEYNEEVGKNRDGTYGYAFTNTEVAVSSNSTDELYRIQFPDGSSNFFTNLQAGGWHIVIDSITFGATGGVDDIKMYLTGRVLKYGHTNVTGVCDIGKIFTAASVESTARLAATSTNFTQTTYTFDPTGAAQFQDAVKLTFESGDTTVAANSNPLYVNKFYTSTSGATGVSGTNGNYYKFKEGAWNSTNVEYVGQYSTGGFMSNIIQVT
jgi:hypothetical protein